jgi:hypothetical protein
MSRRVRILLIWILAAALPLQGYAAAAMISCGPMHARIAASTHDDHGQAGHHGTHDHHPAAEGSSHSNEPSPGPAKLFQFKCSACAACCTASAAPSPTVPLMAVVAARVVTSPFFEPSDHGIVPAGLERPPRTSQV